MLISRDDWQVQTNRFYVLGMRPLERSRFLVITKAGIRKLSTDAPTGARVASRDRYLVPPEAWRPPRLIKRKGPESLRTNRHPESIGATLVPLLSRLAPQVSELVPRAVPREPWRKALECKQGCAKRGTVPHIDTKPGVSPARVTEVLNHRDSTDFLAWGERMAKIARDRGRAGP